MNPEELISKFDLPFADFSSPTKFNDGIGFSAIQEQKEDFASLYKIWLNAKDFDKNQKPLWVSVSYGKKVAGGISLNTGKSEVSSPIDLNFFNEYSYDPKTGTFYRYGKKIDPRQILIQVSELHNLPTKMYRGFYLRSRLWFWRKLLPLIIRIIDKILAGILWLISGERIPGDIWRRLITQKYLDKNNATDSKEVNFTSTSTMAFFGYQAKIWSVVFYCSMHLFAYLLSYKLNSRSILLSHIFRSNFIALCYVVVTFVVIEKILPTILKKVIKITPRIFENIAFKTLEISS